MLRSTSLSLMLVLTLASYAWGGEIHGTIKAKGARHGGNAVIYIDVIDGKAFETPKEHAEVDQKDLTFSPHVLAVQAGTTVDFKNNDDVLHNVFTPDKCAKKFNLGTWPKGESKSFTFTDPCSAVLLCNVHPEMEAYVVTVPTPYFAVSNKDGSYDIEGVPAGKYTLKIWHEKLKADPVEISVPEKGAVTQDFVIHK